MTTAEANNGSGALAAPAAHCPLCGLETGGSPGGFCCPGCENVFAILTESGALREGADPRDTELFRRSLEAGLVSDRGQAAASAAGETRLEGSEELALTVEGMWCTSCAWLIERSLSKERGVISADVLFASDLVKVRYDPRFLPPAQISERIERLGYHTRSYRGAAGSASASDRFSAHRRDLQLRLAVAAFVWLNVMTLSMVFYVGYFESVASSMRRHIPQLLIVLTAPAVFYSAWPILRAAGRGLQSGVLRMESLLALGILAAYSYSSVLALIGGVHYYFDIACAIVTFVLAGKLMESAAKERTARAVTLLFGMMPRKARVTAGDGLERFVAVERLSPGQRFLVKPGERIPADGVVAEGASLVDEAVITGESRPAERGPGSRVVGGSLNTSSALVVAAAEAGGAGTLARMVAAVEAALSTRAAIERRVDRLSRLFVPAVIAISAATFAAWAWFGGDPGAGLLHGISVLVIACPCALGIATPLAISSAVGAASRHGILINHAEALENAGSIDTVVFDKTGTVTEGRFAMVEFHAPGGVTESEALLRLAPIEAASEHPLAQAIVSRAMELGLRVHPVSGVERLDGMGVRACGVFAGNARMVESATGRALPEGFAARAASWQHQGLTAIWFGWEGELRGAIALGDPLRCGAREAIEQLNRSGLATVILSGDATATTAAAAQALGATSFHAEVLPQDKAAFVAKLQAEGRRVAMVGDGMNDAPALAQATLGIAMGTGTALAMQAAPVVLMTPSLGKVAATFDLASRTVKTIRRNLFWAFFYNAVGITLAAAGCLNPIVAAAAMILSSLSVTVQSSRLAKWDGARLPSDAIETRTRIG